ncbi:Uncharacterized protein conserved in bacteria [Mycobacteroides abscessus subsp. abscessus]|uniref:pentapeptide repeat-containing protein n=1 Tax=Mycobacteroides abscessus TaxID=36809 RepID=UPI0009279F96|nr:pentapeptide repeat-containing protein [Mycobacteroides abscessus]SHX10959.1 Uncharacterized protein conserved in bacteria [Mycobacteroides abscessus subsp. abscessus]SHX59445.1 Uncharacterized protein conserved in bacteria [Mycobacteroides abscessus subsp. abscessus]SIC05470.1 Uncharacterized protein conserved in bacteria [Mycobacteroides abscessus subsp. abscessus]SKV96673.1 Uncharacterized protein conserved in bacteria [Mycobacteroides abscessus subsp. abscessus]
MPEPSADDKDEEPLSSERGKIQWLKPLIEAVTALGTIAAIVISIVTLITTNEANLRQYNLAERGQLADRFAKSIEQLASESIDIRVGAIYSLRNIGLDNKEYQKTVGQILLAFANGHSEHTPCSNKPVLQDVEVSMQAIGALPAPTENKNLGYGINELSVSRRTANCWRGIDLSGANFQNQAFDNFDLTGATLVNTDFSKSFLSYTNFSYANFGTSPQMQGAIAAAAKFDWAQFFGGDFEEAILESASFCHALIYDVRFKNAGLADADFSYATLFGVDFSESRDIQRVKFDHVNYEKTKWPPGFVPPPPENTGVSPKDCEKHK